MSSSAVHKMFESPDKVHQGSQERSIIPPSDSIGVRGRSFSKQQLQPGKMLDEVQSKVLQAYTESLDWQVLSGQYVFKQTGEAKHISLMKWCQQVVIEAGVKALYGERLLDIEPDLLQTYIEFDEYSWMIFYKYPPRFAKPMSIPRERIIQAFTKYYQLPQEQRPGQAWYLRALEDEQRKLGIDDRDIGVTSVTSFNVYVYHFVVRVSST